MSTLEKYKQIVWDLAIGADGVPPEGIEELKLIASAAGRRLELLALGGSTDAASALFSLGLNTATAFSVCAKAKPDLFGPLAEDAAVMPGFASVDANDNKEQERLKAKLRLGTKAKHNVKGKQADRDNPEVNAALNLYYTLLQMQGDPSYPKGSCSEFYRQAQKAAKKLHPLTRGNSAQWWKVAKNLLVDEYGERYEQSPTWAKYQNRFVIDGKKRVPWKPDRIRKEIKKKIKQAFRSIAPRG